MPLMPENISLENIDKKGPAQRNVDILRDAYRNIHNDIHTKEWVYFTANNKTWRAGSDPGSENFLFQYLPSGDWRTQSNWVTKEIIYAIPKAKMTAIGGYAVLLTNGTGSATVAGQLVIANTAADDSVVLTGADEEECCGVFLDSGVANGGEAWVVMSGIADVAMEDNTAAIRGNWVRTSITEGGYADSLLAAPPGGGVANLDKHMKEIGHCLESVAATGGGTHILARCVLHFN